MLRLDGSSRVNFVRPAADALFESVAFHYGARALAIVLSGNLHDGTAGAAHVKEAGGGVLAQDEASSRCFEMPESVIRAGVVDFVLSLDLLPAAMVALVMSFGATSLLRVRLEPSPTPEQEAQFA